MKEVGVRFVSPAVAVMIFFLNSGIGIAKDNILKIEYFGHACFQLTSPEGVKILLDPFNEDLGYDIPDVSPDIVLVSHEHKDHNNITMAKGNPKIFRGVRKDGKDWIKIEYNYKDVKIKNIPSYHDTKEGALYGKNAIFIVNVGDTYLGHFGGIGHTVEPLHIRQLGRIDIALIPVGGHSTINTAQANQIIKFLTPKVIVPMHYKTARTLNTPLERVDRFLEGKPNVIDVNSNFLNITLNRYPMYNSIYLLSYY